MLKEKPRTQRYVANTLNCSISTVNKIITADLNIKKAKKYNVHRPSQCHIYKRRPRCITLYEKD